MDVGNATALSEHVEYIDAEAVLPCRYQLLGEVFDKSLQFRVVRVVLDCHEQLRDPVPLEQCDSLLLGRDLSDHFVDYLRLQPSRVVVEVCVFYN